MKHNHKQKHGPTRAVDPIPVRFEFANSTATEVSLAGSFNGWQPGVQALQRSEDGGWSREIALPPGTYEYCLVVDGSWMPDPRSAASVSNPYGGRNSVLTVNPFTRAGRNGKDGSHE